MLTVSCYLVGNLKVATGVSPGYGMTYVDGVTGLNVDCIMLSCREPEGGHRGSSKGRTSVHL